MPDPAETDQTDQPAADPVPEENRFTVALKPRMANYLRQRAAAHGHTPEVEAALIIGAYWAHHDEWRRQQLAGMARPGELNRDA